MDADKRKYYEDQLKNWETFDAAGITTEDVKAWFFGHTKPFWVRSSTYYKNNLESEYPKPLDDKYLRNVILPLMPTAGRTHISEKEILLNRSNINWWWENLRDLIYIVEHCYVKASVKKDFKGGRSGIYYNYLTRLVQFLNTFIVEQGLARILNLCWDKANHEAIHTGVASNKEVLPDFTSSNGVTIELKVVTDFDCATNYIEKLKENYNYELDYTWHQAQFGLFFIKNDIDGQITKGQATKKVLKKHFRLYLVDLSGADQFNLAELTANDPVYDQALQNIPVIMGENGKVDLSTFAAIPKSLLFGLFPEWYKEWYKDRPGTEYN